MFAAGSDKLPAGANEPLARFADAARASASSVRLSARYLTGANKERDFELAKARTGAIRHALAGQRHQQRQDAGRADRDARRQP